MALGYIKVTLVNQKIRWTSLTMSKVTENSVSELGAGDQLRSAPATSGAFAELQI